MEISPDDLFRIIGRKQVEIEMLREHNVRLLEELRRTAEQNSLGELDARADS